MFLVGAIAMCIGKAGGAWCVCETISTSHFLGFAAIILTSKEAPKPLTKVKREPFTMRKTRTQCFDSSSDRKMLVAFSEIVEW
jgi:hypothetical protein